jgi:hypothetical protein
MLLTGGVEFRLYESEVVLSIMEEVLERNSDPILILPTMGGDLGEDLRISLHGKPRVALVPVVVGLRAITFNLPLVHFCLLSLLYILLLLHVDHDLVGVDSGEVVVISGAVLTGHGFCFTL